MARHIYLDHAEDGGFAVRILGGTCGDRTWRFDTHAKALAFTSKRMGRGDFVLDATAMSAEQLHHHRLHLARLRELDDLIAKLCR